MGYELGEDLSLGRTADIFITSSIYRARAPLPHL
jgi:hypothetical protein